MTTKFRFTIPPKSYFSQASKVISQELFAISQPYGFNRARQACFNSERLKSLLQTIGINQTYAISSGTSDRKAYTPYLTQISADTRNNRFYREYSPTKGSLASRKALSFLESLKLTGSQIYKPEEICLTTGTTGAITAVFEYIKSLYPEGEVLIPTPNYYLFKFASSYYQLKFNEVIPKAVNGKLNSLVSVDSLIRSISPNTKLIVLVNPANPSGQIYPQDDLKKLIEVAKKRNILILADEIFSELVFARNQYIPADKIASILAALDNLVIVKGFSKTKNLAALRIGYLFSKNTNLLKGVTKITELRQCFPSASNFTGLICLDSFIQSVSQLSKQKNGQSLQQLVSKVRSSFKFSNTIQGKTASELTKCYLGYKKYLKSTKTFYSQMFDLSLKLLDKEIAISLPKQSAFNTMVKIKDLERINLFDFTLNLYLTTGVKAEIGPCFGFDQRTWESNPQLGFWLRLTFASSKTALSEGIRRFFAFKNSYLKYPSKFLNKKLSF